MIEERVQGIPSMSTFVGALMKARPKTLPIPWNVQPAKLKSLLENVPEIGQVWVERTRYTNSYSGDSYKWTITYLSDLGDHSNLIINDLQLLGTNPGLQISESRVGVKP